MTNEVKTDMKMVPSEELEKSIAKDLNVNNKALAQQLYQELERKRALKQEQKDQEAKEAKDSQ